MINNMHIVWIIIQGLLAIFLGSVAMVGCWRYFRKKICMPQDMDEYCEKMHKYYANKYGPYRKKKLTLQQRRLNRTTDKLFRQLRDQYKNL